MSKNHHDEFRGNTCCRRYRSWASRVWLFEPADRSIHTCQFRTGFHHELSAPAASQHREKIREIDYSIEKRKGLDLNLLHTSDDSKRDTRVQERIALLVAWTAGGCLAPALAVDPGS